MVKKVIFISFLSLAFVSAAKADVGVSKGLFERGRTQVSVSGALGTAFDEEYFVLGLGLGYYLTNGLELGLSGEAWWGENPNIYKLSPELTYVFYQAGRIKPYVGGFYRRTYFESLADLDSYGGRAGLYSQLGGNAYMGIGMVYEEYADCNERIYSECDATYPEFVIGASF